jgi:hypothetical protein
LKHDTARARLGGCGFPTGTGQPVGAGKNFSPVTVQNRAFLLYVGDTAAIRGNRIEPRPADGRQRKTAGRYNPLCVRGMESGIGHQDQRCRITLASDLRLRSLIR